MRHFRSVTSVHTTRSLFKATECLTFSYVYELRQQLQTYRGVQIYQPLMNNGIYTTQNSLPTCAWTVTFQKSKDLKVNVSLSTKRIRVWPVNHLYYDKPYTDKTLQWQLLFSHEQKEDINFREKEAICQSPPSFFESSLPT